MADPIEVLTAKVDALAQGMAEGFSRVERKLDQFIASELRRQD